MNSWIRLLIASAFVVSFGSCSIETAKPLKHQYLTIASDCLTQKDSVLFTHFEKSRNIQVRIIVLKTDSLRKKLLHEGLNTSIDVVIVRSIFDMQALDEGDILQKNIYAENESKLTEKFISKNKSYLGLGYDPYVIVALQDTSKRIKAYSDLAKEVSFGTNLSGKNEIFPFYAAIVSKTKKDSKFTLPQWLNQFVENKKTQHDSIVSIPTNLLFTTYSYVLNEKFKKSRFKDGTIVFPNQRKGGSYYNMCTFGIIKQARNYHNAQLLKSYLLHESVNKQFNYHIKMFPVISSKESLFKYQNTRFKKNSHSPIQESSDYFNMQKLLAHLF